MATYKFAMLVNDPMADIVTAPLGASAGATFTGKDINKAVKLAAGDKYAPCADGDAIDGFVVAVTTDQPTVNSGYNIGSVQKSKRMIVQVVAGGTQLAVGDKVVSGVPLAVGTEGKAQVKKLVINTTNEAGVVAFVDANYGKPVWQVISMLSGTGLATELVLIERVI